MNNYINYYYNIYPDSIHEQNKIFYFHYGNEKYYFIMLSRPVEESNHLYELNTEMLKRGSHVHEIILNKDKNVLTIVNEIPYILIKIYGDEAKKIRLSDLIAMTITNAGVNKHKSLDRSSWGELWGIKIDYFEYQISQIGKKYPIICEYLGYYMGLAENAISYFNNSIKDVKPAEYDLLTIAHKRINANDTDFDLYNPLAFIIDYQVRDLAEYIKARFFEGEDIWSELEEYFAHYDLSIFNKRLLYARLLFPSYFFDVYENIVEGITKENDILKIINKVDQYEKFLVEFNTFINRGNLVPQVDWLNKKNSL